MLKEKCIVLVHGVYNSGTIFSRMRKEFEKEGYYCIVPTLKPSDARYGIEDLALKLKDKINIHLGTESPFVLIGFSMGGIISRYYLQNLDGLKRVEMFFSISSPHHGSYPACLFPGKGMKEMRPGSEFLTELEKSEFLLNNINCYSFRTPFDMSIIPSKSSVWAIAENRKYYSPIHSLMVFNLKVINDIISLIKK